MADKGKPILLPAATRETLTALVRERERIEGRFRRLSARRATA